MKVLPERATATAVLLISLLTCAALAGDNPPRAGNTFAQGADAIGDRLLVSWVENRVQQWQVTAAERRFDEIGWAKDIRDAERLAKKHGRPVFLFTHLGRMATGRC